MGADYKHEARYPIMWNNSSTSMGAGTTGYFADGTYDGTQARIAVPVPFAGIIRHLRAHVQTPPGGVDTQIFTLFVNGLATALTVTLTGAQTDGDDLINAVAVNRGDLISMRQTSSGTAAATRSSCAMELLRI